MKRLLACALAVCVVLPVCACAQGGSGTQYAAENDPSYVYHGNYDPAIDGDSDGLAVIDGVLDEACWRDKKYFTSAYLEDPEGYYANYRLTAFPTEKGVYIAGESHDADVRVSDEYGSLAPDYNTGWEIYFFCLPAGADQNIAQPSIVRQYFLIDANGNITSPTGVRLDAAVHVEGEIGSGETTGMSFEAFIPYSELGTERADIFNMLPIYRAFLPGSSSVTRMTFDPFPWIYTPAFFRFDKDGYQNPDREGAVVGDAKGGFAKSANWDVSREAERIVESKGAQWQNLFFRDIYADKFIIKAEVELKGTLASCDSDPKAGLMVMNGAQQNFSFMVNSSHLEGDAPFGFTTLNRGAQAVNSWEMRTLDATIERTDGERSVTLVLVKNGAKFSLYAEGRLLEQVNIAAFTGAVHAGFYSLAANAVYRNYRADIFRTDEELAALAVQYGI